MPSYYRRRYYYGYRPNNSYSRWTRYSSRTTGRTKRRAIGNLIAANSQKDSTQVNLSITHKCSARDFIANLNGSNFRLGAYVINVWDLLRKSEFYQSYANMYDQIKIDSVKVKLTPVQWSFQGTTANVNQAITIGTAWDRTGISNENIKIIGIANADTGVIGTVSDTNGIYLDVTSTLWTYSSLVTRNLNPGSSVNINRAMYPSTIAEKGLYVNTADLKNWYGNYDFNKCRYFGVIKPGSGQANTQTTLTALHTSYAVPSNPCFIGEDSSIPFKPTLIIGIQGGVLNGNANPQDTSTFPLLGDTRTTDVPPVIFNAEFDVGVTFRGLRKAPIV